MSQVKFQFIYQGLPFISTNNGFNWHVKEYTLDQLCEKSLADLSDVHGISTLIAKRKFTGITDKNGVDVYEGDLHEMSILIRHPKGIMHGSYWVICLCKVVYAPHRASFVSQAIQQLNTLTLDFQVHGIIERLSADIAVIGNIYQNPDPVEIMA
jgi:uncharacterized phage protein (TIGR01671 family)